MTKFKATLFSLVMLSSLNVQCGELISRMTQQVTPHVTPKNVAIGLTAVAGVYGSYKAYKFYCATQEKLKQRLEQTIYLNNELVKGNLDKTGFKIDDNTVFVFDIHNIVAKYDYLKMIKKTLSSPIAYASVFYPKMFRIIIEERRKGSSTQQICEAVESVYPDSENIVKMAQLAIDVTSQLKPVKETVNLINTLIDSKYKVVFASNMEPKLWERFIVDFPKFANCGHFLPRPENNWVKKPSQNYFNGLRYKIEQEFFKRLPINGDKQLDDAHTYSPDTSNILFIDSCIDNVVSALRSTIPSYIFTTAEQLENDLFEMGVDMPKQEDLDATFPE
ncbi:MAG: hypothetical protein P4L22_05275 [Candidatus Babeliales bacterium]|nr:hypothetical protein [Candidatus Babeliales bacterium]